MPEVLTSAVAGESADYVVTVDALRPETSAACEAVDPRIRRTRELLQQALSSLLEEKEFERISVQDITDAATVNRATFYAHYPDKFTLLECMVASRFKALLAARNVMFDGTCFAALRGIVLGVCDYLAQTLSQPTQGATDRQMEPHLESAIVAVVRRMLLEGLTQHPPASGIAPGMLASTASWAMYGAAKEWAHMPDRPSSEEIAPVVVALITPLLVGAEATAGHPLE